jgi:hypothetical protein
MFDITPDAQTLLHAANPLLTRDVVRVFSVTSYVPSTRTTTKTKTMIVPKGGMMPPFTITTTQDGTILVAGLAAECDNAYIFNLTTRQLIATISISDRGFNDKLGRYVPCEWLLPHPTARHMTRFSLEHYRFSAALTTSVIPEPLPKGQPIIQKNFMRNNSSTVSLSLVGPESHKLPYLLTISQEETKESQDCHATYWNIAERMPVRTHSTTVQSHEPFASATTRRGTVFLPCDNGYARAHYTSSSPTCCKIMRKKQHSTYELLLTSPAGDYTLRREHSIETPTQQKRGYVLQPITMTYYGIEKKQKFSAVYRRFIMSMFAIQEDSSRGHYVRLPKK